MAQVSFLRKLAGLLLLGGLPGPALAQLPMAAYQLAAVPGTYVPLPATATAVPTLLNDDVVSAALPLGFQFIFGGVPYTTVVASSNGFLSFAAAPQTTFVNTLGGGPTGNRPLLAPFWDDLNGQPSVSPTARASYNLTGVVGSRVFTFEWLNWAHYGGSAPGVGGAFLSFQVRLYEGSNAVEFSYLPGTGTAGGIGISASIGLAGAAASDFLSLSDAGPAPLASYTLANDNVSQRPAAGQRYRFAVGSPPACYPVSNLTAGPATSTTAQVQFAVPASSVGVQVTYQPVGGGPVSTVSPRPTASPVTLTGLVPGTAYAVTVQAVCAVGPSLNPPTTVVHTAPANDEPAAAGVLPVAATCQPTAGSLGFATVTTPNGYTSPGLCNGGGAGSTRDYDVWYRFQTAAAGAAGSTAVRVAVSNLGIGGKLRAFSTGSGTASGPFTEINCRFLPGGPLDLNALQPATTYFLSVSNAYAYPVDSLARFTICLTPTPACVPPSQLLAGPFTTTTAGLALTPGNGNTRYVVTYQSLPGGPTATATFAAVPATLTGLLPGMRYSASVQAYCGSNAAGAALTTAFTLPGATAPANDTPAGAVPLAANATCQPTASTTAGATSGTPAGGGCGSSSAAPDVWFSFATAAAPALQNVLITVAGRPAGQVRLYDGTTRLACAVGTGPNRPALPLTGANLPAGRTYLIAVGGYAATDTAGAFTVCLQALAPTVSPANDACAQATALPVTATCQPLLGTTLGATPSTTLPAATCIPATSADVWYRAVVPASGAVTFLTSAAPAGSISPLTDTEIEVYDGTCGSLRSLGCNDDAIGAPNSFFARLALAGLVPGTPLLVRVVGYAGRQGSFGLCATSGSPRPCAPPTGLTVTPTSATAVVVSFSSNTGSSFRLEYAPVAGGAVRQTYVTASPATLTNLLPNTQYTLSLYTSCDSSRASTPTVTLPVTTTFTSRPAGALATAAALAGQVELYPNPAHTRLTLKLPADLAAAPGSATLRNALGQSVLTQVWAAQAAPLALPLDVSQLAPGIYWLRLQTAAGPLLRRVVVE